MKPSAEQVETARKLAGLIGTEDWAMDPTVEDIAAFLDSRDEALIRPWREAVEELRETSAHMRTHFEDLCGLVASNKTAKRLTLETVHRRFVDAFVKTDALLSTTPAPSKEEA